MDEDASRRSSRLFRKEQGDLSTLCGLALVVFIASFCTRQSGEPAVLNGLEFRIAVAEARACEGCTLYEFKNVLSEQKEGYAKEEPALALEPSEIRFASVAKMQVDSRWVITLVLADEAVSRIERVAKEAANQAGTVLVFAEGAVLGGYEPDDLAASHGIITLAYTDSQTVENALRRLGMRDVSAIEVSRDEAIRACVEAVGKEERLRVGCKRFFERDIESELKSLQKVEKMLDSESPDYEGIFRELDLE